LSAAARQKEGSVRFIQEFGFNVKRGRDEQFQEWLRANEDAFAKAHPEGSKYLGTFVVVFGSEKQAGEYRTLLEHHSYGALDRASAAARDAGSEYGRLARQLDDFVDVHPLTPWSRSLYRATVDATVWNVE
jgi:hypothetical protein